MKPTAAQYAAALLAAFQEAGDHNTDQIIDNLLKVLAADGALELYPAVVTEFEQLALASERVSPRVAFGREQQLRKAEADALNALAVEQRPMHETVAEELVGGAVIRVGDTIVDGSVAGALARMRTKLGED